MALILVDGHCLKEGRASQVSGLNVTTSHNTHRTHALFRTSVMHHDIGFIYIFSAKNNVCLLTHTHAHSTHHTAHNSTQQPQHTTHT
jgi:hypothetical protein